MTELKPCPFCGGETQTYKFEKAKRKVMGIYHEICIIKCDRCTCTIRQAGPSKYQAEQNAKDMWNRRVKQ